MPRRTYRAPAVAVLMLLASASLVPAPARAQGGAELRVLVLQSDGRPLAGAGLWADGRSTLTDADGRAVLRGIRPGSQFVRVRADGYRAESITLAIESGALVEVEVQLEPLEGLFALPLISVEAERQVRHLREGGFYQRKRLGLGTFLERTDGGSWDHLPDASHLLRGVRGLRLDYDWRSTGYVIRSTRGATGLRGECTPQLVVDGMPWSAADLSSLPASQVAAVEVYTGPATSPPRFAFNATGTSCGTIVFWLRGGSA